MPHEIRNQMFEMWKELKQGQDVLQQSLNSIDRMLSERLQNTEIKVSRLETYAAQGKWALGAFSIPIIGGTVKFLADILAPHK